MKLSWMGLVSLALFCLISVGCQSGVKGENASLKDENQKLKARLADSEAARRNAPDPNQLQTLQSELAQRDAQIRELQAQLRRPDPNSPGADPGIAGIATSYDRHKGEMTVSLPSDILFAPGSADLKPGSRGTLDKVVSAVKRDYAGKRIRVEGHTDRDPIVRSQDKWIDNLDLSQNRAGAVARFLMEHGIEKSSIATVGYGDTHPKGSKAASRRVEIIVVVG